MAFRNKIAADLVCRDGARGTERLETIGIARGGFIQEQRVDSVQELNTN